ncbi:helix-turn-helix domain-containing protein [Carnobacterium funditum]|uniref:helix-turn-helix domain-containing protein n=1 Tax=Carnobacterium funditum TaxID=2752 RepID=UPI0006903FAC|nr:helix-turn-helix transcriptional regulator [Carnobacterium funditum]
MNGINMHRQLVKKRKEKKVTQAEVAKFMGVSKASVSKWEKGNSLPDITLLPKLATYYNLSIDELLGYSPHLTTQGVRERYQQFAHRFVQEEFQVVFLDVQAEAKEYYADVSYLLALIQLLLNHADLASEKEREWILQECLQLTQRVQDEAIQLSHLKQANTLQAIIYMALNQPDETLGLLEETLVPYAGADLIYIQALMRKGELERAGKLTQVFAFQSVITLLSQLLMAMQQLHSSPERFKQTYQKADVLIHLFQMDTVATSSVAGIYHTAAAYYAAQSNSTAMYTALNRYVEVAINYPNPVKLTGNDFFDQVDEWLEESLILGQQTPREASLVRKSFEESITKYPAFQPFIQNKQMQKLLHTLNNRKD